MDTTISAPSRSLALRLAALLFAVALLAAVAFAVLTVYFRGVSDPRLGQDAANVCAAVDAYRAGLDPYYVKNLKADGWLSFTYPPVYLDLWRPICSSTLHIARDRLWLYPLLALAVAALALGRRAFSAPLWRVGVALALVVGGFDGFAWDYTTGNIQWLSALGLAAFLALARGNAPARLYFAAALLGLYASLKFIEAPALLCLLLLPTSRRQRLALLATAASAFLAMFAVSYFAYGDFFSTFVASLAGRIPGQHSPATEGCNVSLYCFSKPFAALLAPPGLGRDLATLLVYAGFIAALVWPAAKRLALRDPPPGAATLALLLLYLIQPRLKQYTFFDPAVALAAMTFDLPAFTLSALGVVAVLAPAALRLSGASGRLVDWSQAAELLAAYLLVLAAFKPSRAAERSR